MTKTKKNHIFPIAAVILYTICILLVTLSSRPTAAEENVKLQLFWSYIRWLQGDTQLAWEIVLNIGVFMPFGFLVAGLFSAVPAGSGSAFCQWGRRHRVLCTVLIGLAFSFAIEAAQYCFHLGTAELDDLFSNTLGTAIGAVAELVLRAVFKKAGPQRVIRTICAVICLIAGILGCLYQRIRQSQDELQEEIYAFTIGSFTEEEGQLAFSGYSFSFDRVLNREPVLLLTADHVRYIKVDVTWGIARPEVSEYYFGDDSRAACGYEATVSTAKLNPAKEYDLVALWPGQILPADMWQHFSVVAADGENHWVTRNVRRMYAGNLDLSGTGLTDLQQTSTLLCYNEQYGTYFLQAVDDLYLILENDKAPQGLADSVVTVEAVTSRADLFCEGSDGFAAVTDADRQATSGLTVEKSTPFTAGEMTGEGLTGKYRVFRLTMPAWLHVAKLTVHLTDPSTGNDYLKEQLCWSAE